MPGSLRVVIDAVLIGQPQPFGPNGEPSAIAKRPVVGPLWLDREGFAGDAQADRRHHGGPDKAVHHYAAEHYPRWRAELPDCPPARFSAGGFGENLSSSGLTEADVCAGDVFELGAAVLQVAQARQPCWKLNQRFDAPDLARRVQANGRSGWYYRVVQRGRVAAGDALCLRERPHPEWPLARLLHHLYIDPLDRAALEAIAALAVLPPSWRALALHRLRSGQVEDWSPRLDTPARL